MTACARFRSTRSANVLLPWKPLRNKPQLNPTFMKLLGTISGTTTGGRDGHGETSDGLIKADFKSKGGGPTPEHFFALGYSACFGSALNGVGRLKKVQIPADFSVTVKVDLNVGENHDYSLQVEL